MAFLLLFFPDKPFSHKKSNNETAYGYINGQVNLTCSAEAEPNAEFKWFVNKTQVIDPSDNPKYQIFYDEHASYLEIQVNDAKVFTEYRCEAQNTHGKIEHFIKLRKGSKPEPPSKVSTYFSLFQVNNISAYSKYFFINHIYLFSLISRA